MAREAAKTPKASDRTRKPAAASTAESNGVNDKTTAR
jgi:hypothetical protein